MIPEPRPLPPLEAASLPGTSNPRFRRLARYGWIAAPASALLWAAAFPPWNFGASAFVFALPAIGWAWFRPRWRTWLWSHAVSQAIAWAVTVIWLRHIHPVGGPLAVVGLASVLATIGLPWWMLVRLWVPRMLDGGLGCRVALVAGLAGCWVLLEALRGAFLTGFPWLPLAASQWSRPPLLQAAAVTGAGGVSALLVVFNVALFSWAFRLVRYSRAGWRRLCPELYAAAGLLLWATLGAYGRTFPRTPIPWARVGVVQPDIPQDYKWDPAQARWIVDTIEATARPLAALEPDLVIWPEAVLPASLRDEPFLRRWTESAAVALGAPVVLGSVVTESTGAAEPDWFNGAFIVTPESGVQPEYYAKRHLVPFGEYVPLRSLLGGLAKVVDIGSDFSAGSSAAPLQVDTPAGRRSIGTLICYEDAYAGLARDSARAGAEVLAVLTNNAWFGREAAAYQHMTHAVLRAVETRRPVIRVGNSGWTGWIDEYGAVRDVLADEHGSIYLRGAAVFDVRRDSRWMSRDSFYTRHGDWFLVACALAASSASLAALRPQVRGAPPAPASQPTQS